MTDPSLAQPRSILPDERGRRRYERLAVGPATVETVALPPGSRRACCGPSRRACCGPSRRACCERRGRRRSPKNGSFGPVRSRNQSATMRGRGRESAGASGAGRETGLPHGAADQLVGTVTENSRLLKFRQPRIREGIARGVRRRRARHGHLSHRLDRSGSICCVVGHNVLSL